MDTFHKGEPIAFRPDKDDEASMARLVEKTRLTRSEIARRALHLAMTRVETEGSIGFLFGIDGSGRSAA